MSAAQVLTGSGVLSAAGCRSPVLREPRGMSVVGMSQAAQSMAWLSLELSLTCIPLGAGPAVGEGGVCVDNQV